MLYSIVCKDKIDSLENRKANRPAHLARLQALQDEGKLILAGPNPNIDNEDPGTAGFSGSIIVAEFSSLNAARSWANEDPFLLNGVYEKVTVKPFKQVFPK